MHAASVERSPRLRLTLSYLTHSAGGRTTQEIQEHTGSMAPATDVSELRAGGHRIRCRFERMERHRRVYRYTYEGFEP